MKIAFVCTANTCRSPMAEYLLKNILRKTTQESFEYQITSFGVAGFFGDPAELHSLTIMNEIGIDMRMHRSKKANPETLDQDLFLTMTVEERDLLLRYLPDQYVFTLKEFSLLSMEQLSEMIISKHCIHLQSEYLDISAPTGDVLEDYRNTRDEILDSLSSSIEKIQYLRKYF